jgi:hypothetical protein
MILQRVMKQRFGQDIRHPFLCLNISCPAGAYDPNVEPSKSEVIFAEQKWLLQLFERFCESFYLKERFVDHDQVVLGGQERSTINTQEGTSRHSRTLINKAQQPHSLSTSGAPDHVVQPTVTRPPLPHDDAAGMPTTQWTLDMRDKLGMSSGDEEETEGLHQRVQAARPQVAPSSDSLCEDESEKALQNVNPWVIARMNAPRRPTGIRRQTSNHGAPYHGPQDMPANVADHQNIGGEVLKVVVPANRVAPVYNASPRLRHPPGGISKVPGGAFRSPLNPISREPVPTLTQQRLRHMPTELGQRHTHQHLLTPPSSNEDVQTKESMQQANRIQKLRARLSGNTDEMNQAMISFGSAAPLASLDHSSPVGSAQRISRATTPAHWSCARSEAVPSSQDIPAELGRGAAPSKDHGDLPIGVPQPLGEARNLHFADSVARSVPVEGPSTLHTAGSTDPRVYLIRRQQSASTAPFKKRRRLSTKRLPLESIPMGEETYPILQHIDITPLQLRESLQLQGLCLENEGDSLSRCLDSRALSHIEHRLRALVQITFGVTEQTEQLNIALGAVAKGKGLVRQS